ncbi:MAG: hypothetical protein IKM62_01985 [Kiritimatiellae bacterium]|nr:hypothetical protein [Kiritimatiellia bacterium]
MGDTARQHGRDDAFISATFAAKVAHTYLPFPATVPQTPSASPHNATGRWHIRHNYFKKNRRWRTLLTGTPAANSSGKKEKYGLYTFSIE